MNQPLSGEGTENLIRALRSDLPPAADLVSALAAQAQDALDRAGAR